MILSNMKLWICQQRSNDSKTQGFGLEEVMLLLEKLERLSENLANWTSSHLQAQVLTAPPVSIIDGLVGR